MRGQRIAVVSLVVVGIVAWRSAPAAEKEIEYYKAGDVGAFAATVALPPDVDLGTHSIWARANDDKLYLLYVELPLSLEERLSAAHRHQPPPLPPEQKAQADAIDKQIQELYRKDAYPYIKLEEHRRQLVGLKAVLDAELAKKAGTDEALVARTREAIKEQEAAIKRIEADWRAARAESEQTYKRIRELEAEKRRVWEAGHKELREAALAMPVKVLGRFQEVGKASLSVLARRSDDLLAEPRLVTLVDLDLPPADGGERDVLTAWATAQAREAALRVVESPYSSYYQYCLLQSLSKYGVPEKVVPRELRRDGGGERRRPDLYSMATGALAIQESLQLDAMTRRKHIPEDRTVPLSSLAGPGIKSHPFEQMIAGRTPKMFPMASLVPFDAYYAHFSSISKALAASDLVKQWGSSLLGMLEVTARDSDVPAKFHEQLCLGVSELTRLLGDLLIGEVALTGNDPFFCEGTDLTVIIQVKERTAFAALMKGYLDTALAAHPDAKAETATYEGVAIASLTTPDCRISSHAAYLGDCHVRSNSLDALKRIIDTHAKRRKSMAENPDFQYMRTIFPGTPGAEDGFIYLSDAFIRKLVGPRWKIQAQRRMVCQGHLHLLANAATMYRAELRKPPTFDALVKGSYLPESDLTCPDGGVYSLEPSGRARCSVHNALRYCTPIDSVAIDKVSKAEAEDYTRFVTNYDTYWRQYFDPIGIRLKVGNRIEVETCILPLIENSMYNQLRDLAGGKPVSLSSRVLTDRTILSVAAKLDVGQPNYRETINAMQRALFPSIPPIADAVGTSLSLNLCDSDVLFTIDERGLTLFGGWMGLEEQLIAATVLSAINLPLYAVLELKDEKLAETIIGGLLAFADVRSRLDARPGRDEGFAVEHYAAGDHNGHPVHTLSVRLFLVRFRLYYAIASRRLIVATKRYVLESVLDTLDKPPGAGAGAATANVLLDVRPRAFDKLLPVTVVGWQERLRDACLRNLVPARALLECHGATEDTLGEISRRIDGVTLRCPSGGAYRHDRARDLVYCTLHGDLAHARQPVEPTGKEEIVPLLRRLRDFSVAFRFTDEGIMTKVAFDLEPAGK